MTAAPTPPAAPASDFPIDAQDLIVGLGRGLAVMECFDDEHPRQTVAEVARRTGIPRTATRRHLLSLCHFGYAQTDGKQFWLAPRVLRLGQSYLGSARLPRLVQPFIQQLSRQTGETVNVSVLDGHEVVYIARSNSPRLVSIGFHAGERVLAHLVTPGPVLLATLKTDALQQWLAGHDFSHHSGTSSIQAQQFQDWVEQARQQGYWITEQMLDPSLAGVAVMLTDRHGKCHGALSMTLQVAAWPREVMVKRLVPLLLEAVQTLRSVV